ncbi:MAG: hypothetical protein FJ102_20530, partial [Deltaproteobacteria bacterium]|nr:hypothetical protein [Deltaproteobacteria bacterium]
MSVAAVVRARAAAVLGATLVATGVATAVALWIQAGRALDQALLAAAHERAHPESSERWEVESGRSPVHTWLVNRDDPDVPPLALERALASERASCVDDGARRLCLLPAEAEIDGRERHVLVAARADRPRLVAVVGPFAIAYGVLGSVLAA